MSNSFTSIEKWIYLRKHRIPIEKITFIHRTGLWRWPLEFRVDLSGYRVVGSSMELISREVPEGRSRFLINCSTDRGNESRISLKKRWRSFRVIIRHIIPKINTRSALHWNIRSEFICEDEANSESPLFGKSLIWRERPLEDRVENGSVRIDICPSC